MVSSDLEDKTGLMQRDDAIENLLRSKVTNYVKDICV
jgi:hypothetical protein